MTTPAQQHNFPPHDDERDLLVDSLLEEMLGGVTPPDVTSRVLAALAKGNGAASGHAASNGHAGNGHAANRQGRPIPIATANDTPAQVSLPTVAGPGSSSGAYLARRRRSKWLEWSIAGGVVAGCAMAAWLTFGSDLLRKPGEAQAPIAAPQQPKAGSPKDGKSPVVAQKSPHDRSNPPDDPTVRPTLRDDQPSPKAPAPGTIVETPAPDVRVDNGTPPIKKPTDAPVRPKVRSSDAEVIASIDRAIRQRWAAATVTPSARATDAEWLRRVFLAVLGRIPKLDEIEPFLADRAPNKREAVVDRLLTSDLYANEFARNWTNVYTEALLGHTAGDLPTDKTNRAGLQQYLRRSFLENKPYDVLTAELLTATGSTQPGAADFNGATNFLVDKLDASGVQATVKTAQIFLGVQVQCTQCHNHPFNDWKQGRFWELNAFFRQAKAIGDVAAANGPVAPARIADQDFHGEGDQADDDAEVYYEERNGRLKVAYPVFFDGTAIARNGEVSQVNRRSELSKLVTASPWFADAAVNRVWSHFFGHGFTKPIDDMGPHNPPTHPELLERLSGEFAGRNYDLKALIRWIALSEAYSLSSKPSRDNLHDDPTDGDPPLFSRYYLRQMRAEQLYESLAATTNEMRPEAKSADGDEDQIDELYAERERDKAAWMQQFVLAYRTDECDECSLFVGSIPQTLSMMNGEMTADATNANSSGVLAKIAATPATESKKVQQLFLAALARNPSPGEQTAARRLLSMHGNTAAGLEDLWWALLNSNEFILDR